MEIIPYCVPWIRGLWTSMSILFSYRCCSVERIVRRSEWFTSESPEINSPVCEHFARNNQPEDYPPTSCPIVHKQATGLDAWASRVKCPARFVSHLHEICIYIYIWVVYSLCFICLLITVTGWYVWCIEWASGNQEEVQACLVTLWLFIISCYSLYKTTLGLLLKIIHIFINTQWIFMFTVSI